MRNIFPLLLAAIAANATAVYDVRIDTSSLSGGSGAVYFQFAGGLHADPASVIVTLVSLPAPGAWTGTPTVNGGVTGALPAPVTLQNSSGLNDYLHFLDFGSELSLQVLLDLPALLTGSSGSSFAFGLTASDGLTPLLTSDPAGFLGIISYDANRAFQIDTLSAQASIESLTAIPEPGTLVMVSAALLVASRQIGRGRRSPDPSGAE